VSRKDASLAAAISEAAQQLGLQADPAALQVVGIAVAQDAGVDTRPFWEAAFGYRRVGDGIWWIHCGGGRTFGSTG